jgi:hypothetical protein
LRRIILGSSSNGEKNPRKVLKPIGASLVRAEAIFEVAVEPFHDAISLWMIGRDEGVVDGEEAAQEDQTEEVNCGPQSEVKQDGIPNLQTQPAKKALAQSAAEVAMRGNASDQREQPSITVSR